MSKEISTSVALVSVIIPSYNHGHFIMDAIHSIWQQNYPAIEIIIIDDGSTDNTRDIVQHLPGIYYVYQPNKGLSAARNAGIHHSKGEYLVFLDADDWLYPDAIATNLNYIQQNELLAFVSGAFTRRYVDTGASEDQSREIQEDHYCCLLQGNYIGMFASIMFRRRVFKEFYFDVHLRACEDYDLNLKITRKYPVLHHTQRIAVYRIHNSNMSGNISMMLNTVLKVLDRQKKDLQSPYEINAFNNGHKIWKEYYCNLLYQRMLLKKFVLNREVFFTLLKYQSKLLFQYFFKN